MNTVTRHSSLVTRHWLRSGWLPAHAVAVFAFLYLPIAVLIIYSTARVWAAFLPAT
jgi:ABC-type spermidine/putrescine transport system permease subunit II